MTTQATQTDVVPFATPQRDQLSEALARAFFDDPLTMWVVPGDNKRRATLPWFFAVATKIAAPFGHTFTTPAVEGGALWLPPGKAILGMGQMIGAGMLAAPFKFGLSSFMRFMNLMNHMEHLHKRDVPQDHWYLMVLGVDPPRQGQGLGGALIAPILERADREGLPCYLETMKEINVTFYRKHGFEVVVDDVIPKGGPRYWTMLRQPKAQGGQP
jgi:ribosomal protein S18 acetylase RimI-like enzyme